MYELINFSGHTDDRGSLAAINELPFSVNRIFILDINERSSYRGNHAHKELKELLIPITGSFSITLEDNKRNKITTHCTNSNQGILIYPHLWRTLYNFAEPTKILSLCSHAYDDEDYIRNWEEFINDK